MLCRWLWAEPTLRALRCRAAGMLSQAWPTESRAMRAPVGLTGRALLWVVASMAQVSWQLAGHAQLGHLGCSCAGVLGKFQACWEQSTGR